MATNPYRAASAYRDHSVTTASPARLVVMIFDRLVLDLDRAIVALSTGQPPHQHLIHAQELIMALLDGIDTGAWEHASQLVQIYAHIHQSLVKANVEKDADLVRDCLEIVSPLRDAWAQAATVTGDMSAARKDVAVNV